MARVWVVVFSDQHNHVQHLAVCSSRKQLTAIRATLNAWSDMAQHWTEVAAVEVDGEISDWPKDARRIGDVMGHGRVA